MYYVYKYIDKNANVLYVGQTIDLDRRFNEHKGKIWDLEKEKILFAECNSCVDMCIYEMYYINKLQAKYNTALVYDMPTIELPELSWQEYNKNHFELKRQEVDSNFRNDLNNRFSPEIFYGNKIKKLKEELELIEDPIEHQRISTEIKRLEERKKRK